mmetsp:Transcript_55922/g.142247  ORF Transcript_55922/g.142247 Transcript_55922/m.142247 type:complete len:157 (+) Transcript_55922:1658-2128(+)
MPKKAPAVRSMKNPEAQRVTNVVMSVNALGRNRQVMTAATMRPMCHSAGAMQHSHGINSTSDMLMRRRGPAARSPTPERRTAFVQRGDPKVDRGVVGIEVGVGGSKMLGEGGTAQSASGLASVALPRRLGWVRLDMAELLTSTQRGKTRTSHRAIT